MKNILNVSESQSTMQLKPLLLNKLGNQFRSLLLFIASILSVSSAPALANYQYTYTGNPFTVTNIQFNTGEPPPYDTLTSNMEENLSVVFYSPTLLSNTTITGNELPFIITSSDDFLGSLPFPNPNPIEPGAGLGSPGNPFYIGTFDILSVNSLGLPTDWNISVNFSYNPHRNIITFLKTTTSQDSVFGSTEGQYEINGELNNNPGQWHISVVPEPETYAYMLSGLALIGLVARRRKNNEV